MSKYIDREKLPQFQYYNFCEGIDNGWDINNGESIHAHYLNDSDPKFPSVVNVDHGAEDIDIWKAKNDFTELLTAYVTKNNTEEVLSRLAREWLDMINDKNSQVFKIMRLLMFTLKAMIKDKTNAALWYTRIRDMMQDNKKPTILEMLRILALIDEYILAAQLIRTAQGFPLYLWMDEDNKASARYPKMLLIEDELYKQTKSSNDIKLDYYFLQDSLRDQVYVVTINGESAERKMSFCLFSYDDRIVVFMADPKNGLSEFYVMLDSNLSTTIKANMWRCHPRGDYDCSLSIRKDGNSCEYCNGVHSCRHRSLDIVSAVLYCFQEYHKKLADCDVKPATNSSSPATKKHETAERYIPDGMMRMYDIKLSDEEYSRINKFAMFSHSGSVYPSTEKCPHVRRGTMRYNPKTGKKDIRVRGSIIHKDKYKGFSSTERVTQ